MKYRGTEYFEVLPDGWIEVTHSSGIPVYLHKTTRVCTLSRPYFLGPGSVRNHEIPLAAVPCLHQRKIKENEVIRQKALADNVQVEKIENYHFFFHSFIVIKIIISRLVSSFALKFCLHALFFANISPVNL